MDSHDGELLVDPELRLVVEVFGILHIRFNEQQGALHSLDLHQRLKQ